MSTKIAKGKARQERPKLKVMHIVSKDENGNASITSRTVPKLKEAIGPDVQQAAEETGHKVPKAPTKTEKPKDKPKDEIDDEQRRILKALDKLGGKDIGSMALAKEAGTVKSHPDAPRAPIRAAMEAFSKHGWVTRHKKGAGYLFSLTDKGKQALSGKDKEAGSTPASNPLVPSERPANTDIKCPKCRTWNVYAADYCKQCGAQLQAVKAAPVAA